MINATSMAASPLNPQGGGVIYVDADAQSGGDGTSWATAFNDLQDGLAAAQPGDEIWVAEGVYKPDRGTGNRDMSFRLVGQVALYGGFEGDEQNREERDPSAYASVLDGDIGAVGDDSDNTRIIVLAEGVPSGTILNGFTIRRGRTDTDGAGYWGFNDFTRIERCTFVDNHADDEGGALRSSWLPEIVDCVFEGNTAGRRGGAVYMRGGTITGCVFQNNVSETGGALFIDNYVEVRQSVFADNHARHGGALSATGSVFVATSHFSDNTSDQRGGAAYLFGVSSPDTTFLYCDFVNNDAGDGAGGVYNGRTGTSTYIGCRFLGNTGTFGAGIADGSSSLIANCAFSGNLASGPGGAVRQYASTAVIANTTVSQNSSAQHSGGVSSTVNLTVSNSILWGNDVAGNQNEAAQISTAGSLIINNCCVQGWSGNYGGSRNTGQDPLFVDADGTDDVPGTEDDNLALQSSSPCANAGDNSLVPPDIFDLDDDNDTEEMLPFDLLGNERLFGRIVDMGAIESEVEDPVGPGVYVGPKGGSWFVPAHWKGGQLPDESTHVFIRTRVIIDQAGARAATVTIMGGGDLVVQAGSLQTTRITVESGGSITMDDTAALVNAVDIFLQGAGDLDWRAGQIILSGGVFHSGAEVAFGQVGDAQLLLTPGSTVDVPRLTIGSVGTLAGTGTVAGDVENAGRVAPGASIGSLLVNGQYDQTQSGTLAIEIGGYSPGVDHDRLTVSGASNLSGTLFVTTSDTFRPHPGLTNQFLIADALSGDFDSRNIEALPHPFVFLYSLTNTSAQLLTTLTTTVARLYVNAQAAPGGDGQSWATAMTDLQGALFVHSEFPDVVDEIWAAEGLYRPDRGSGDRSASFVLKPQLAIYGGFEGSEENLEDRDVDLHPTILSGDLLQNDPPAPRWTDELLDDNSLHVVIGTAVDQTAVLDGFTIEAGHADLDGHYEGAGALIADAEPTLRLCTFRGNTARDRGGAVSVIGGAPSFDRCTFDANFLWFGQGGAMHNDGSATAVADSLFVANHPGGDGWGGAIFNLGSDITVTNTTFDRNEAPSDGRGGAIYEAQSASERPSRGVYTDCVFIDNDAEDGGAVMVVDSEPQFIGCEFRENGVFYIASGGAIHFTNSAGVVASCVFTRNHAVSNGGAMRVVGSTLAITDTIFDSNDAGWGGAVAVAGLSVRPRFTNCDFIGNHATSGGGAVHNHLNAAPTLERCSFVGNTSDDLGGALYLFLGTTGDPLTLDDCFFDGNSAENGGDAVFNRRGLFAGSAVVTEQQDILNSARFSIGAVGGADGFDVFAASDYAQQGIDENGAVAPIVAFDIGGRTPIDEFDVLDASRGAVTLDGGGLEVTFVDSFEPEASDAFEVIRAQSLSGGFDVISLLGLPPARFGNVTYLNDGVVVNIHEFAGSIGFADPDNEEIPRTPTDAVLADFDQDGDLDLALTIPGEAQNDAGSVFVLFNAGNDQNGEWLGFGGHTETTIGANPVALVAGHFNSDDYPDIAAVNRNDNSLSILMNDADGEATFTVSATLATDTDPVDVASGDFGGDSDVDLAVTSRAARRVRLFLNNGSGTFTAGASVATSINPSRARLADLGRDQDLDLLTINHGDGTEQNPPVLTVNLRAGGSFEEAVSYGIGAGAAEFILADLNLDTYADVITVNAIDDSASILINDADGSGALGSAVEVFIGDEPSSLTAIDLELDGDPDLAFATTDHEGQRVIRVVRNDFDGEQLILATTSDLTTGGDPIIVRAGDVNGDSIADLIGVNEITGAGPGGASVAGLLNRSIPANAAELIDLTLLDGFRLAGDLSDLRLADNQYLITEARVTGEAHQTHLLTMRIGATTEQFFASSIGATVEGRISDIDAAVTLFMRDWATGQRVQVDQFRFGLQERTHRATIDNASRFVRFDGRIELDIRQIVLVPFTLNGFNSFLDQVQIMVNQ